MTTFDDGPAKGQTLMLSHSPKWLRVTEGTGGASKFDALDDPRDWPEEDEKIHVYKLVKVKGTAHVSYADKQGKRRGFFGPIQNYRYVEPQPDVTDLRTQGGWQTWVLAQPEEN